MDVPVNVRPKTSSSGGTSSLGDVVSVTSSLPTSIPGNCESVVLSGAALEAARKGARALLGEIAAGRSRRASWLDTPSRCDMFALVVDGGGGVVVTRVAPMRSGDV